jgi:biopolymer transport protein ExbD
MRKREEEVQSGRLTAMIDIVFQLIIFFVCTTNLQDSAVNSEIALPEAPNGAAVTKKDPREINIDVDAKGRIFIVRTPLTQGILVGVLKKAVAEQGQDVPIVIRADGNTKHSAVKQVMDACTKAGLYRIQFAALKESSGKATPPKL